MRALLSIPFVFLILSGCEKHSESTITRKAAFCRALEPYLPTWSEEDSQQSIEEGAEFIKAYEYLCSNSE